MVRKIIWTKRANIQFNNIINYLEQEWGEQVTENSVRKTYDIIELLSDQSDLGTLENSEKQIRGFFVNQTQPAFLPSNR